MKKVSIIIPVYNGSNYLKKAIESAINQTYKNIEILIINDGSTDNGKTEKIAKSYGNKIKYYKKNNGGVASALNYGIKKSTGDYISWLSHDDLYESNKIEEEMDLIEKMENKNSIIFSDYEYIDENDKILENINISEKIVSVDKYFVFYKRLISGISLLIPKSKLIECGLFDTEKKYTQDYDMWYRLIQTTDFYYLNKNLVKVRLHSQQSSNTCEGVLNESENFWRKIIEQENELTINKVFGSRFNFYIELYNTFKYSEYNKLKKYLKNTIINNYFEELFDKYYYTEKDYSQLKKMYDDLQECNSRKKTNIFFWKKK